MTEQISNAKSKFKKNVLNMKKQLSAIDEIHKHEANNKQEFIDKYGVQLNMPANYIFEGFFFTPNTEYIINACTQVFPENLTFYDYDKIATKEDPKLNDFLTKQQKISNKLIFKTYYMQNMKYQEYKIRICDPSYQQKICFSHDKTKVAIFRREVPENNTHGENIIQLHSHYVIDVFDCSSIDFFLRDEVLTHKDPNLLFTIRDKNMAMINSDKKMQQVYMYFSYGHQYLLIEHKRQLMLFYNLQNKGNKVIDNTAYDLKLPPQYEKIMTVSINEENIMQSMVAAKKTDFRNIDIFPLQFLQDLDNISKQPNKTMTQQEIITLSKRHNLCSIRLTSFNLESTNIKFTIDRSKVIYCDKFQKIELILATDETKEHQRSLNHIRDKPCREIVKYGESDFLVATADPQDKEITIQHASDASKKIKFYIRFAEDTVKIRDIFVKDNRVKVLMTRDDEEFVVYEFEDFQKETFWQRFYDTSNYIFEWPYVCYLMGQHHVIVQNGFNSDAAIYIELKGKEPHSHISHIFLTEQFNLYIVLVTGKEYQIFEKDLDICANILFQQSHIDAEGLQSPKQKAIKKNLFISALHHSDTEVPVAKIPKDFLDNKSLYKIFIRDSSSKEVIQTNLERMMFFICDFKIYCLSVHDNQFHYIDRGYKFKTINQNLIAFNTVDNKGRKSNVIKFLKIGFSEFEVVKVFEEVEGRLVEFLVQDNQLLILSKANNSEIHSLKIFDIIEDTTLKLKNEVCNITDIDFIGRIQTVEQIANNMIPAGNDIYTLVQLGDSMKIHFYTDVLPIDSQSGQQNHFFSPLINTTYRKMIYFTSNKKLLKPKTAIILPYINDNYILFNKRENLTQFCQFYEYRNLQTLNEEIQILNIVPFTQQALHYTVDGRLLCVNKLKNTYQIYGEYNLTISPNGEYFLQTFDEDKEFKSVNILRIYIQHKNQYERKTILGNNPNSPQFKHFINAKDDIKGIKTESFAKVDVIESLHLDDISVNDELYKLLKKDTLSQVIQLFKSNQCEVLFKMNDNLDILIGFIHTNKVHSKDKSIKYLKELLLVKRFEDHSRKVYKIRLQTNDQRQNEKIINDYETLHKQLTRGITQQLLTEYEQINGEGAIEIYNENQDYEAFLRINEMDSCIDFRITGEKILTWSRDKIYHFDFKDLQPDNNFQILKQIAFQIENLEESHIDTISAYGQNLEDQNSGNYYIYIKLIVENSYSFFIKYNVDKMKEFSSFDCSLNAMVFFDKKYEGFILDDDSIIDIDQGIPLYFYKTGMKKYQEQYLMGRSLDKGSRFCNKNNHFVIRNRLYIPYCYLSFILIQANKSKPLDEDVYDPEAFFCLNGNTSLHLLANNYKNLEFLLNQYEKCNPKLINMILLKNKDGKNVLDIAMEANNSRSVNLILEKLSNISMNNIHSLKEKFHSLLEYNAFENYLKLCFFSTIQMNSKTIFKRKSDDQDANYYIAAHSVSFLDKDFYDNFQDDKAPTKPVKIRSLDAGWLLKYKHGPGQQFLQKLSNCEDMRYFSIDTVQLMIKYQWKIMKPLLIYYLFIPFIVNMIFFNVYCIYLFELIQAYPNNTTIIVQNWIAQGFILAFSVQTFYVEYKQITFHKEAYLQSFWNIIDLLTVVLAPLIVILHISSVDEHILRQLMAICNIFFYLRFFYFLRIFDNSAHLVRTIIEITYDIRNFIFILNLAIIGFGASFYILSNNVDTNDSSQSKFIDDFWQSFTYSYRLSLGDFSTDDFDNTNDPTLLWIFFIISSMFSAIIMLNMLVAIMGESFNRVNEQSENQRVREHLQLIVENDFLINRRKHFGNVKYLIEIKDDNDDDQVDIIGEKLNEIEEQNKKRSQTHNEDMNILKDLIKKQSIQISHLTTEIHSIKNHLSRNDLDRSSIYFDRSSAYQTLTEN